MKKRISVLLLCCIVFISGCNMPGQDDQKIKKLDPEKLDSERQILMTGQTIMRNMLRSPVTIWMKRSVLNTA